MLMLTLKRVLLVWLVWHFGAISLTQAATDCNAVNEISPAECTSLLQLYHSTDGDNWHSNVGWNLSNTPCSWYGITCWNHSITKIVLNENQLTGTIPNFNALPNLQVLSLNSNQLTGTIPNFSALPNLQWLYLSENQMTGQIPNFSALPNLHELYLYENQLTGTIPNFSGLPNLHGLSLCGNQLTGTIPNFSGWPNLLGLDLSHNQLTGTIPNFSALPNLQHLYLSDNQLTGTIPNFTALPNLQGLYLDSNQLMGTIPNFSALPNLNSLYLHYNQLTGMIPVSSNTLINLRTLALRNNPLCKKADYDYAIWPIVSSWNAHITWQAQLETFPICPTETGPIPTVLSFIRLKEYYQIGEIVDVEIAVNFTAENPADTVDLWIAIQQPSENFLYMSALPLADLFSPKPQFFREDLGTTQETFSVISDFKVPKGVGGNYTFYAALVETGKNPLRDGAWVMRHIVKSSTLLSNR
ncbi:MAG: leucine-rich repeat domain-containing protein [Candidatus Parabeggiatoa sp.]|nr:leucine-rich repeat domain-containing protein [Candidatus Parabeggiatoa sp.]